MQKRQLAYQRVGIIHGYAGSGARHWQTWLARNCRLLGAETHYPKLPGRFAQPTLPAWLEAIERTMPVMDESTALIGHSLGCPTILQLLREEQIKQVGLIVLVAPSTLSRVAASELGFLRDFYENLNGRTACKAKKAAVFTSDNDRWVDPYAALALALELHADFHLIKDGGHLNVASGHHTFPEVLDLIVPWQ